MTVLVRKWQIIQNPDLLLYRYKDESDGDKSKFGVLNWQSGN